MFVTRTLFAAISVAALSASANAATFNPITDLDGSVFNFDITPFGPGITEDNGRGGSFQYTDGSDADPAYTVNPSTAFNLNITDLRLTFTATQSGAGTVSGGANTTFAFQFAGPNAGNIWTGCNFNRGASSAVASSTASPDCAFADDTLTVDLTGLSLTGPGTVAFDLQAETHAPVPLPAPLAMLLAGLAGLGFAVRRKA